MQEKTEIITTHFEHYWTKIPKNGYCVYIGKFHTGKFMVNRIENCIISALSRYNLRLNALFYVIITICNTSTHSIFGESRHSKLLFHAPTLLTNKCIKKL